MYCSFNTEGQGFEPWAGYEPTPVFKTGTLNHSVIPPQDLTKQKKKFKKN